MGCLFAKYRFSPLVGGILGLLRGLMAETFTIFLDIVGHGDIDIWSGLGSVMPIMGKATVSGAGPVNGHTIVLFYGCVRWSASALLKYLPSKSSMESVNVVLFLALVHNPGVCLQG